MVSIFIKSWRKCPLIYFAIVNCTRDRQCIFLLILSWRVLCRYIIKNSLCFAYTFVLQTDATMYHFLFIFFSYLILSLIRVLLSCYMNEKYLCLLTSIVGITLYSRVPNKRTGRLFFVQNFFQPIFSYLGLYVY